MVGAARDPISAHDLRTAFPVALPLPRSF